MLGAVEGSVTGISVPSAFGRERGRALVSLGCARAHVAQAVEHLLGKEKVPGSNPGVGSNW